MTSINKTDILNSIDFADKNELFDKLNDIYKSLPSGDCTGCGKCCMESVGINLVEYFQRNGFNIDTNINNLEEEIKAYNKRNNKPLAISK